MSDFTLSPATLPDLPGIATVSRAAFAENQYTMSYWMFPQDNERAIFEWRLQGIVKTFESVPHCAYTKVVDSTIGNIVAFALWEAPHSSETEEEGTKEKGDKDDHLPEGTNVRLLHDFDAETRVRTLATFSSVLVASHASKIRSIILYAPGLSSNSDFKHEKVELTQSLF